MAQSVPDDSVKSAPSRPTGSFKISISKASGAQIFDALNITKADMSRARRAVAAATGAKRKRASRTAKAATRGLGSSVKSS